VMSATTLIRIRARAGADMRSSLHVGACVRGG
jgi:hypothetical protein